jgi:hypothetical protein
MRPIEQIVGEKFRILQPPRVKTGDKPHEDFNKQPRLIYRQILPSCQEISLKIILAEQ